MALPEEKANTATRNCHMRVSGFGACAEVVTDQVGC
jgi:hypothetical protein